MTPIPTLAGRCASCVAVIGTEQHHQLHACTVDRTSGPLTATSTHVLRAKTAGWSSCSNFARKYTNDFIRTTATRSSPLHLRVQPQPPELMTHLCGYRSIIRTRRPRPCGKLLGSLRRRAVSTYTSLQHEQCLPYYQDETTRQRLADDMPERSRTALRHVDHCNQQYSDIKATHRRTTAWSHDAQRRHKSARDNHGKQRACKRPC